MNKDEEWFQKRLTLYSVLGTMFVAVITVLITLGFTWTQFNLVPSMDNTQINNSTAKAIQTFSSLVREEGNKLVWTGIEVLIAGMVVISLVIISDTSKRKLKINKSPKILFDEMYDGKDIELKKKGYDAHSVKKLRLTGEPIQYDYSVIKYAKENKMILITEDPEICGGCQENNLPCIKLGQNPSIDEIVKELESLKDA